MTHATVEAKRADIVELCRRLGVRRLHVFGSATGRSFDEATSDVDSVVELAEGPDVDAFDAYFSLKEGLEGILGDPSTW